MFFLKLIIKISMFKDYSKGIKYASVKKKKKGKNKTKCKQRPTHTYTHPDDLSPRWKALPAAAPEAQKASCGTTCSEGVAAGAFPGWAAGQPGPEVWPPG